VNWKNLTVVVALLAVACSKPEPKPTPVPVVEKEETAAEWRKRHCIGKDSECSAKPAGIKQERRALGLSVNAILWSPATDPEAYGWGKVTTGGTTPCLVSNMAATGAGSFSSCARQSGTYITFSGPGPYVVDSQQTYLGGNNTIDGCANGQTTVTLSQKSDMYRAIVMEGVSNVAIRCIRFEGNGKVPPQVTEHDLFAADGTDSPVSKIFIDRSTFIKGSDGALDITGNTTDVTVQRSLIYGTGLSMLVKYGARARLTFYQNALVGNCERNPQIKGALEGFLWASNVSGPDANPPIIDGENGLPFKDCYGMLAWTGSDSPGEPKGNIVDSAFYGKNPFNAIANGVYQARNVGATTAPASTPYVIPPQFDVPQILNTALKAVLPTWGAPVKTAADVAAIQPALALLPGSGGPTPTPSPSTSPSPSPSATPTATPTPVPTPSGCPTPGPTPTPCPTCPPPVVCPTPRPPVSVASPKTCVPDSEERLADGSLKLTTGPCVTIVQ